MPDRSKRLEGRVIVVTGAARGIGAQTARQAAAECARVIVSDIQRDAAEKLAGELPNARFFQHDVGNEDDWHKLTEMCLAEGGVHGLVNNAGIYDPRLIEDTDVAFFERNMRINQLGPLLGIQLVQKAASAEGASIVNLSSLSGLRGTKGIAYTATKWALRGMTRTAAVELAPRKIRGNSINPAFIDTPMLSAMSREHFEMRQKSIPLGRAGTVEDVANLIVFLLCDDSSYITGSETAIDGGLSA